MEERKLKDDLPGEINRLGIPFAQSSQEAVREVVNNRLVELAMANKDAEATDMMNNKSGPAMVKLQASIDELAAHQVERTKKRYD